MNAFTPYLENLNNAEQEALQRVISIVQAHVPDAEEGLAYGMPAFKYNGRPLIGFSSNSHGLNLYPFDPKVIATVKSELADFEVGKGVIRFSPEHTIPEETIVLLVALRLNYLESKTK